MAGWIEIGTSDPDLLATFILAGFAAGLLTLIRAMMVYKGG
jgi:hypothetical protein